MKRSLVALSVLALALTGCTSETSQSGGDSNPDSQVTQPPLPGEEDSGTDNQGGATPRATG
jgi:hypothetical protein